VTEDFKFIKNGKALTEAMEKKKKLDYIIEEDEDEK
jgi:hypothetical protein